MSESPKLTPLLPSENSQQGALETESKKSLPHSPLSLLFSSNSPGKLISLKNKQQENRNISK
jgi:hypothetical protein